ncbi:Gpi16 subunit, GPI transamidase component [Serendipita vermifera]|nr:Gpi16 subunit, GPI transamidase component [Serendipita vermifera]
MRWSSSLNWLIPSSLYLLSLPYPSTSQHAQYGHDSHKATHGSDANSPPTGQPGPQFKDIAYEKLLLKPLPDGNVATHFEFEYINRNGVPRDPRTLNAEDEAQHYQFFPMSMGQILREFAVAEMHLTLNSGRWRYDKWGYPENPAVASGAELWAWMAEGGPVSTEERWSGLSNALAGLFCVSLASLPQSRTTTPFFSFQPEGHLPLYPTTNQETYSSNVPPPPPSSGTEGLNYTLYHAILPSENICTENLTPFIKLLPCKSYAGFAELLNPHRLFGGWWYGVGIHATWSDGSEGVNEEQGEESQVTGMKAKQPSRAGVNLKLTVGAVLDPRAHTIQDGKQEWSLESLFGRNITTLCPVTAKADAKVLVLKKEVSGGAEDSMIDEESSNNAEKTLNFEPSPDAGYLLAKKASGLSVNEKWEVFRIRNAGLNLTVIQPDTKRHEKETSPLSITRALRGYDQTRGGLTITITNALKKEVKAWYVETIPWIIKPYLSSIQVEEVWAIDQQTSASQIPLSSQSRSEAASKVLDFKKIHYAPPSLTPRKGRDPRTMPTLLEIPLVLPAKSVIRLSFEFEKAFLKYTEHPPDAQRGWEMPGGVLIPVDPSAELSAEVGSTDGSRLGMVRMYTPPLLADLATPDFSMPYNVIILSGALIALLFGMLFNMLVRRFVLVKI